RDGVATRLRAGAAFGAVRAFVAALLRLVADVVFRVVAALRVTTFAEAALRAAVPLVAADFDAALFVVVRLAATLRAGALAVADLVVALLTAGALRAAVLRVVATFAAAAVLVVVFLAAGFAAVFAAAVFGAAFAVLALVVVTLGAAAFFATGFFVTAFAGLAVARAVRVAVGRVVALAGARRVDARTANACACRPSLGRSLLMTKPSCCDSLGSRRTGPRSTTARHCLRIGVNAAFPSLESLFGVSTHICQ
ncbi:hypothetical protein HUK83_09885, partial [Endobacter medicaginis]